MVSWYRGYHDCAEGNAYTGKVTSARVSSCRNISKTGEQHICNVTWWPGNWDWEWDLPPLPLAASTSQSTRPGSCRHPDTIEVLDNIVGGAQLWFPNLHIWFVPLAPVSIYLQICHSHCPNKSGDTCWYIWPASESKVLPRSARPK